jgi:hypothetical protein
VSPRQGPSNRTKASGGTGAGSGKAARNRNARERLAEQRAAQRKRERTRTIVTWSVTGVIAAALATGAAWAVFDQQRKTDRPATLPTPAPRGNDSAPPPWPLPADPVAGAKAAGLSVQPMEGTAKHFHAHVDILAGGKPVAVPANIGVSPAQQAMSELHTHDDTGLIHIEAPTTNKRYTLGQLFDEWQVKLAATGIGGLKTDAKNTLSAYVDGKPQTGDPAAIELLPHREIALVYGPPGAKVDVPKSYNFRSGE